MPEGTLKAFADHGKLGAPLPDDGGDCEEVLVRFVRAGVDVEALAAKLQDEGAKAFVKSWNELLAGIAAKSDASLRRPAEPARRIAPMATPPLRLRKAWAALAAAPRAGRRTCTCASSSPTTRAAASG